MYHSLPLLSTMALAFALALIFGYFAEKIRMPALVGYLVAGVMCGANTPGPVANLELAQELSEIGVILLMFGVGLHFSIEDLLKVKGIAIPGATLQMGIATVLGTCFAHFVWEWSPAASLIFGLCLSCASTVVMLKALDLHGLMRTVDGQISVGWLVVEDIVAVIILVLLPPVAVILGVGPAAKAGPLDPWSVAGVVAWTVLRVVAFVALMLVIGRKLIPWALIKIARTGSRELFNLSILASAIGIAFGAAAVFDVSFALGAFFAGMVMRETPYARRAARDSLPLQDAFAVLFFVGVGMMLDWHVLFEQPLGILTVLSIIIVCKSLTAFTLVHCLRYPLHTSLTVAVALAQIGEFSFMLAAQGIALGMVNQEVLSMIVAASILSIALNPLMFASAPVVRRILVRSFAWARAAAMRTDHYAVLPQQTNRRLLQGQTIVVGTGDVASGVRARLLKDNIPMVSIVDDLDVVEALRSRKLAAIAGDAADPMVLVQAHITTARVLVIMDVSPLKVSKIVENARQLNPDIQIVIRAVTALESEQLAELGVKDVMSDADSLTAHLSERVLDAYASTEEEAGAAH